MLVNGEVRHGVVEDPQCQSERPNIVVAGPGRAAWRVVAEWAFARVMHLAISAVLAQRKTDSRAGIDCGGRVKTQTALARVMVERFGSEQDARNALAGLVRACGAATYLLKAPNLTRRGRSLQQ